MYKYTLMDNVTYIYLSALIGEFCTILQKNTLINGKETL